MKIERIMNYEYRIMKKGFSLIELIITVTIIAILTVVAVVNFGGTNTRARDQRRLSDLEKIRSALEMARQVGVTYPADYNALVPTYLNAWPTDPKTTFSYYYNRVSGYTYQLWGQMEDLGNTNNPGISGCGGRCNYLLTQP